MGSFGRRALTLGGLALAAASPFARVSRVLAGGTPAPRRLVIWHVPAGTVESEFRPVAGATESDFALGRILEPLERHRSKLMVFGPTQHTDRRGRDPLEQGYDWRERKGISIQGSGDDGHTLAKMLTGVAPIDVDGAAWGGGPSIDQVVAERIGAGTPFRSLELAVHDAWAPPSPASRMIYSAAGTALPPMMEPRAAFDRVFAGVSGEPDPALVRAQRRRRALVDFGRAELEQARARLGVTERRLLDAHAGALDELDRRIDALAAATCTPPARPGDAVVVRPQYNEASPELYRAQVDVMAHALGCDLTRVASISFGRSDSHTTMPWLGGRAATESHHGLSHTSPWEIVPGISADGYEKLQAFVEVHRWYMGELARFMDLLAAMPEGDGTVLDHTLIFAVNEISEGQFHTAQNMPWLLAGGASGALRMGRYVRFDDVPHQRLLLSIAHAMGLTDLTTFGDPALGTSPLDLA